MRPSYSCQPSDDLLTRLLAESASGAEGSFQELYEQTSPQIYARLVRLLRSPDQAADVAQETYQQVWRQAGSYDPSRGSAMAWISVIARHRAIDRIRSNTRRTALETRYAFHADLGSETDQSDEVISRLDAAGVRRALTRLSPIQREALVLRYFRCRSLNEMADDLSIPLGTVKTRIRDATLRLRRNLDVAPQAEHELVSSATSG